VQKRRSGGVSWGVLRIWKNYWVDCAYVVGEKSYLLRARVGERQNIVLSRSLNINKYKGKNKKGGTKKGEPKEISKF